MVCFLHELFMKMKKGSEIAGAAAAAGDEAEICKTVTKNEAGIATRFAKEQLAEAGAEKRG